MKRNFCGTFHPKTIKRAERKKLKHFQWSKNGSGKRDHWCPQQLTFINNRIDPKISFITFLLTIELLLLIFTHSGIYEWIKKLIGKLVIVAFWICLIRHLKWMFPRLFWMNFNRDYKRNGKSCQLTTNKSHFQ